MPKRKPPVPSPDSLSPSGGGGGGGAQQVVAPQSPVSTLHSGEQAEIEALCASVQSKLEEQRRIAQHANELGLKPSNAFRKGEGVFFLLAAKGQQSVARHI